jgi:hypothetical protein
VPPIRRLAPVLTILLAGCGFAIGPAPAASARSTDQAGFWTRLTALCGRTFEGRMTEGSDSVFVRNRLTATVRDCTAGEVRIGFAIGPDPSRTWIVRRTDAGLALRHEIADPDPGAGRVSGYGGATRTPGTARRQDFAADSATARLLPPAAGNVWSLEIDPGRTLAYTVWRPGVARRFRLEFDLAHPAAPSPGA